MTNTASTPPTLPPLPLLPHPSSLTIPGAPSSLIINEARRAYESLDLLRQSVLQGTAEYQLEPPNSTSLPPLPPIPLPPKSSYRRLSSSPASSSSSSRPVAVPSLPSRFKADSPKAAIEAFNLSGTGLASIRYNGSAVFVRLDGVGAVWVLLKGKERMEVENVRVLTDHEENQSIHSSSSSAPYKVLSKHLTSLDLSLPDLLFRLTSLAGLITQACIYCSQHLRVPDGLPYGCTGWLPDITPSEGSTKQEPGQENEEGEEKGKWVCWHPACEPAS